MLRKPQNIEVSIIKVNNKKIHGGYFYDEDEARLAYNELAKIFWRVCYFK